MDTHEMILDHKNCCPSVVVLGNLNIDLLLYPVNDLPEWGHEKTARNMLVRTAGSAGYTALALGQLGINPIVLGNGGNDEYGSQIVKSLMDCSADVSRIHTAEQPTGVSVTMINQDAERAFVTYCGHLQELTAVMIVSALPDGLIHGYAHFSGLFLLPAVSRNGAMQILQSCRDRGMKTILDTGDDPSGWTSDTVRYIRRLLHEVDIFVPNEDEAMFISGKSTIEESLVALRQFGPELIIVKSGSTGSFALSENSNKAIFQPSFSVKAIDTTGAGDTFNAGIIYGLSHEWELPQVLEFANGVAAIVVSRSEKRYPTLNEVGAFIKKRKKG